MGEMLDTYSCSHSCKFNYSKSFLLGWYEHGQNIPILEVEKKRKEQLSNGNREAEHVISHLPIHANTERVEKIIGCFNRLLEQKQKIQYICAYLGDS